MKQRIMFFGSGAYTIPIIEVLKHHGLVFIVTTEVEGKFITYLKKQNIPFISSDLKNKNAIEKIKQSSATLGVLASYGAIIPKQVLDLFPHGILNIHPSLLPKYKGPSPIQATILSGDKQTGVTIIKLDEQVDHGPIIAQERVRLLGNEATEDLKKQLFAKGAEMITSIIHIIEVEGMVEQIPQDHSKEPFTEKITRENGRIDINYPPSAKTLDRMIRAYYPWPSVWTEYSLFGKTRRIKLLPNNKIQVEGKRVMTLPEFVNGYQQAGEMLLSKLALSPSS